MNVKYQLKDKELWVSFTKLLEYELTGKSYYYGVVDAVLITGEYKILKSLYVSGNDNTFFEIAGEKIRLMDFCYLTIAELVKKISSKEQINRNDIIATLVKERDSIIICDQTPKTKSVFYMVDKNSLAVINRTNSIKLLPIDEEEKCEKVMSMMAFSWLLQDGVLKMIDKNTFNRDCNKRLIKQTF